MPGWPLRYWHFQEPNSFWLHSRDLSEKLKMLILHFRYRRIVHTRGIILKNVALYMFCKPRLTLHKICQIRYIDLSTLLHGFVEVITCICKDVTCISRPLPNQTKLELTKIWTLLLCWRYQPCNVWVWYGHQFPVRQFTAGLFFPNIGRVVIL